MGIVIRQSFNNTLILFLGFGIGGLNVLFLYTHFLEAEYFGLITFLLSTANMIMPLMVFGMQHTIIKFFSSYSDKDEQDNFLWTAILLPLVVIIPLAVLGVVFYQNIAAFLSRENIIIEQYTFTIFLVSLFMGYFEVFYAWSRVQMQSVFGNFIKEVFARLCVSFLLFAVYLDILNAEEFIYAVVIVYFIRVVIMKQVPFQRRSVPQNIVNAVRFGRNENKIGVSVEDHLKHQEYVNGVIDSLGPYVTILDPLPILRNGNRTRISQDGKPLYRDADHLSFTGSQILRPIFEPIFKNLSSSSN